MGDQLQELDHHESACGVQPRGGLVDEEDYVVVDDVSSDGHPAPLIPIPNDGFRRRLQPELDDQLFHSSSFLDAGTERGSRNLTATINVSYTVSVGEKGGRPASRTRILSSRLAPSRVNLSLEAGPLDSLKLCVDDGSLPRAARPEHMTSPVLTSPEMESKSFLLPGCFFQKSDDLRVSLNAVGERERSAKARTKMHGYSLAVAMAGSWVYSTEYGVVVGVGNHARFSTVGGFRCCKLSLVLSL